MLQSISASTFRIFNIMFTTLSAAILLSAACSTQIPAAESTTTVMDTDVMDTEIMAAGSVVNGPAGYYRYPAIHGDVIVFGAEGDLWKVSIEGGAANRLTTHPGEERNPVISPDGSMLAFTGEYEGPSEVYTMSMEGGLPVRQTYEADRGIVVGWTADGRVIYTTNRYSTLPSRNLVLLDVVTGEKEILPLAQAADGCFDDEGRNVFFVRLPFQGSQTKRYKGGTAQNLWKFDTTQGTEATALTADYAGTSKQPMFWKGRLYFLSDRDDTMNIWSMKVDGSDLQQHTKHVGWDVMSAALGQGRIVYQLGADIHVYDIAKKRDRLIPITLNTDFDQMREKWITDPIDWLSMADISPDGDRVVLTARGELFVAPQKQGRIMQLTRQPDVRYRVAHFMPDGETIITLSDESGEVEFWTMAADGSTGERTQLTYDGNVLRWDGVVSPDGKWMAHYDKNFKLWMMNLESKVQVLVDESGYDDFSDLRWAADSRWLAYVKVVDNQNHVIRLYNVESKVITDLTTDRYDSRTPAWSVDGKWIYFLSDRNFRSLVGGPWGPRQPEPFFDRETKIYAVALQAGLRSPFAPETELTRLKAKEDKEKEKDKLEIEKKEKEKETVDKEKEEEVDKDKVTTDDGDDIAGGGENETVVEEDAAAVDDEDKDEKKVEPVEIELEGLCERLYDVPVEAGNYYNLFVNENRIFWTANEDLYNRQVSLMFLKVDNQDIKVKTLVEGVGQVTQSQDLKKLLVRKGNMLAIIDSSAGPGVNLGDNAVNLSGWAFSLVPQEEWRQMFVDAWRLERDYFYDTNMHGVDWEAMLDKYLPLVDRVSNRAELSDLIAQMVGEVSALHTFVYGGDQRGGSDNISIGALGAVLQRDEEAAGGGGYVIKHIYLADPDEPDQASPLAQPDAGIAEGDVILSINNVSVLSVKDIGELLRNQVGKQVLLELARGADNAVVSNDNEAEGVEDKEEGEEEDGGGNIYKAVVVPVSTWAESGLRYDQWEYTRRLKVEEAGNGDIGYVHLRAMGRGDIAQWTRDFYPVHNRKALIVDVRHNGGGNIDSWILEKLLRKIWFYWQGRVGEPTWNMQYAFPGHMVVLCNEHTGSDGEAFAEGFRRLGFGKVIGTRTWGGEIWLSSSNSLVDRGIATAAEFGVFGPDGEWLIEGHGVDPDIVVDNLPHATYMGSDAQLDAALAHLQKLLELEPVEIPKAPDYPDKSSGDNKVK